MDRYLGLVPNAVTPCAATIRQSASVVGCAGEPSHKTMVVPVNRPDTSQFHIIHPQVVK